MSNLIFMIIWFVLLLMSIDGDPIKTQTCAIVVSIYAAAVFTGLDQQS